MPLVPSLRAACGLLRGAKRSDRAPPGGSYWHPWPARPRAWAQLTAEGAGAMRSGAPQRGETRGTVVGHLAKVEPCRVELGRHWGALEVVMRRGNRKKGADGQQRAYA